MKHIHRLILSTVMAAMYLTALGQDTEDRSLPSFSKVTVSQAIKVVLVKGNKESASIEVRGAETDDVKTDVSGSALRIRMNSDRRYKNVDVKIRLTYKEIEEIEVNSAAKIVTESAIKTDYLEVSATSAADAVLEVEVEELSIDVTSSGSVEVSGNATVQDISVTSAGSIDAFDLVSEEASVKATSAGNARVHAVKRLEASANSAGSIRYRGNPAKTNVRSNSGGSIRRVN
ncbi:head GIN domain-containing protein [Fulvivirgaceae bacterium BMA10]|uniref:Head GIN domain-containing protein n=1 Tax=Splendidivirga corallicola TaxID=3051826 RepID=A0ABT8KUH5_9BACT|nr:head GIN domain-containing protein [Fulvivirgaceae bacterium BMA10]